MSRRFVIATLAVAIGLWQTQTTEAQGPPGFSLPPQAVEIAPGVFSLGTAIYNGRTVEGIAIATHKGDKTHGGPFGGGGGGDDEPPTEVLVESCYSFIFSSAARWFTSEPYLFNSNLGPSAADGVLDAALGAALGVWDSRVTASIFGGGESTTITLSADTNRGKGPDGLNEVYFDEITGRGSSSTIAFTIVWAYTTGEIIEWDMVFNTNFSWSVGDPASEGAMDFLNIAAHEVGHAAGMGHTDTDVVCVEQTMYPTASNGETQKRDLDVGDKAGIAALYQ